MNKYTRNFFFQTPDKAGYDRFSRQNTPSKETWQKLFNSIPFFKEVSDTATQALSGIVKIASDAHVLARTEITSTSVFQEAVAPHQLPNIYVSDPGTNTVDSTVSSSGLKISNLDRTGTVRRDFLLELILGDSLEIGSSEELQLVNDSVATAGQYYGTASGATTLGYHDLPSDEKVKVVGGTASYLNASYFTYIDDTVKIVPLLSEGYIWMGYDHGGGEIYAKEYLANTAFNKDFGYTTADIVEIGTNLGASEVVLTDSNYKLETEAKATAFNKAFAGSGSATTVARSDHSHDDFAQNTDGFVPGPTTVTGVKFLRDDGTWQDLGTYGLEFKVKSSALDTAEYLEDKIDTNYFEMSSYNITLVDDSISFDKLDSGVIKSFSQTLDSAAILSLNSSPVTLVSAPSAIGYAIELIDWHICVTYSTAAYATNTNLRVYASTATESMGEEQYALTSTVTRNVRGGMISVSDATKTQIIANKALLLDVETGDPTAGAGNITVAGRYRIVPIPSAIP